MSASSRPTTQGRSARSSTYAQQTSSASSPARTASGSTPAATLATWSSMTKRTPPRPRSLDGAGQPLHDDAQTGLLLDLPHRGVGGRLAGLDPAAGHRPLAATGLGAAPDQKEAAARVPDHGSGAGHAFDVHPAQRRRGETAAGRDGRCRKGGGPLTRARPPATVDPCRCDRSARGASSRRRGTTRSGGAPLTTCSRRCGGPGADYDSFAEYLGARRASHLGALGPGRTTPRAP